MLLWTARNHCTWEGLPQVRAVVVCRPPGAGTSRRLSAAAAAEGALSELDISDPVASGELPPDAPDADLCRDVAVGREAALRLPLYGYRGAAAEGLCQREVAPLLRALLAGESAAVIAYGQTGGMLGRCTHTAPCQVPPAGAAQPPSRLRLSSLAERRHPLFRAPLWQ